MPTATLPNYEKGINGTIYRRLARIAANCRVEGVSEPSLAYKVIYTPETNLPPFIGNARSTCGFGLVGALDGNTLPVKKLRAGNNVQIIDCGSALLISTSASCAGSDCDNCDPCKDNCIHTNYPIVADCDTISLKYHPCEFWTDYDGQLRLSCGLMAKIDNAGGACA